MKRKDYELVARGVRGLRGKALLTRCSIRLLACENLVAVFKEVNGNFNEQAFRKDCGIDLKKGKNG